MKSIEITEALKLSLDKLMTSTIRLMYMKEILNTSNLQVLEVWYRLEKHPLYILQGSSQIKLWHNFTTRKIKNRLLKSEHQ